MTDENNNNNNQPSVEEKVLPGSLLQAARIKAGLSAKDLASKVNLRVGLIEALESNEFDDSVSPTFTRGYLKLLAKTLDMPEAELLAAYDALNIQHKPIDELQSFSRRTTREANDSRLMVVSYIIVIALVALAVLWWVQQDSSVQPVKVVMPNEERVAAIEPQLVEPIVVSDNSEQLGTEEAESGIETVSETTLSPDKVATNIASLADTASEQTGQIEPTQLNQDNGEQSSESLNTQQEVLDSATLDDSINVLDGNEDAVEPTVTGSQERSTETESRESSSEVETPLAAEDNPLAEESSQQLFNEEDYVDIQLSFSRDCWVKLSDATGEDIAYGIKANGYIMDISGVPPIEVTLCAPEFVKVMYNGEAVDMSRFRQARTAKFQLPLVVEE